ncbi:MAG: Bax inhibitor-1 family protein [Planctomycetota bacterium]|nr:Bax inhibitor-1 family protein [Planctomycetota bacterium]
MSYADNPYQSTFGDFAANAAVDERAGFLRKTYAHLLGAVLAFAALEAVLLTSGFAEKYVNFLTGLHTWAPFILLGGMMLVSYVASSWAQSTTSKGMQYAGLGLYVALQAVLFMPILYIINTHMPDRHLIETAGIITALIFGALTAIVFATGANFNWLRSVLVISGIAAMIAIGAGAIMGFSLGIWFSAAMILFACGWILYDTSAIMREYRTDQYVAASLALFASVMILFFYVLRFLMQFTSND